VYLYRCLSAEVCLEVYILVGLFCLAGFLSGSIPWSVLLGKILAGGDIRSVGDGNPGTANTWKLAGPIPGLIALILDVSKAFIPVFLFITFFSDHLNYQPQMKIAAIGIAPVLGHAWTPVLKFRGGKALATSLGSWMAVTTGSVVPGLVCVLLILHVFQKNHALTVTIAFLSCPIFLVPLNTFDNLLTFWLVNAFIIFYKHRHEYSYGILPREWLLRMTGRAV